MPLIITKFKFDCRKIKKNFFISNYQSFKTLFKFIHFIFFASNNKWVLKNK